LARKTFSSIFAEAVDDALSSLGDSAKQSIYYHLEDKFGIQRKYIPARLDEFESGLDKIFGVGARYIEILIIKSLHDKLHGPLEWNDKKELVFADYVNAARHSYAKASSKRSVRAVKS
jgi:hypothetical protein